VSVEAVEPNFEDIESALEEPQNEVVSIDQENPHSNNIHIAHNIPTGSDITVTQKAPYNATVHISLNIAKECKVKVSDPHYNFSATQILREINICESCFYIQKISRETSDLVQTLITRNFCWQHCTISVTLIWLRIFIIPKVQMDDAVNSILHISVNNGRMSEVEVEMKNAFNCSVLVR